MDFLRGLKRLQQCLQRLLIVNDLREKAHRMHLRCALHSRAGRRPASSKPGAAVACLRHWLPALRPKIR